ncbi:DNA replication and repair protein RecF [Ectothiorhodosinus mongolicus]|uniref:DNA replication and repair protein RecF n=1 Tax=Ectothiorhodosinus mongolicus TaxID=233100 RepID=A0A1R3VXE3_9GAMM|nr:DNA replication/repair protein RecF [Ectothiorhodosinus mongolicus]ULX57050.1 DNA replication/repair protein RecF [Ectothiorhodosinus mongolicus]SIT69651.1 DNA replication and repair protein RecF [Ectothiorhodosinus mongolicus]
MGLTRLDIFNLRIISRIRMMPVSGLNLIVGPNASGKTSLLEAISLLATGRSFRSARVDTVVREGQKEVMVAGLLNTPGTSSETTVGISKGPSRTRARIAGRSVHTQSDLARLMPVQMIHPDSHSMLTGGPSERRAFVDWGLFHTQDGYAELLRDYRRVLSQRNDGLRHGLANTLLRPWEIELERLAKQIDEARGNYLTSLLPELEEIKHVLPEVRDLEWSYRRGWRDGEELSALFEQGRDREREVGHTLLGPHRADIAFKKSGIGVSTHASRGQQKSVVLGLRLIQVAALFRASGQRAMVLIDDLPSELDAQRRQAIGQLLAQMQTQVFVTAIDIDPSDLGCWKEFALFHVEHGGLVANASADA